METWLREDIDETVEMVCVCEDQIEQLKDVERTHFAALRTEQLLDDLVLAECSSSTQMYIKQS